MAPPHFLQAVSFEIANYAQRAIAVNTASFQLIANAATSASNRVSLWYSSATHGSALNASTYPVAANAAFWGPAQVSFPSAPQHFSAQPRPPQTQVGCATMPPRQMTPLPVACGGGT